MHNRGIDGDWATASPVTHVAIDKNQSVTGMVTQLLGTGFNAKRLGQACQIYEHMVKDPRCVKILTLAGAMVPAGMRAILADFIRCGYVDILVSTGANLTHDMIEAVGQYHYQGSEEADDAELHELKTNRIFDVFLSDDAYETMEGFIMGLSFDNAMSTVDFLDFLGGEMEARLPPEGTKDSILVVCHDKHVPLFCPGFTDSGLGIELMLNHRGLKLDQFEDLSRMINRARDLEDVGVFIIGGGVPKNFTFQSLQFSPNSARYAIQITTDRPEPGGLSGASLSEAVSWEKASAEAETVTVVCDATIVLPIVLAYLKDIAPYTGDG
jgi:deoxyhypusine synthase